MQSLPHLVSDKHLAYLCLAFFQFVLGFPCCVSEYLYQSCFETIASPFLDSQTNKFQGNVLAGVSKDELFGQFFAALEKIDFFKTMPDGNDDPILLDKASWIFHDALNVCF